MKEKSFLRDFYAGLNAEERLATAVGAAVGLRARVVGELQRSSRWVLTAWSVPTEDDVTILRSEIVDLERLVGKLSRQVEVLERQLEAQGAKLANVEKAPVGKTTRKKATKKAGTSRAATKKAAAKKSAIKKAATKKSAVKKATARKPAADTGPAAADSAEQPK